MTVPESRQMLALIEIREGDVGDNEEEGALAEESRREGYSK